MHINIKSLWEANVVTIKPNPTMSLEQAHKVLLDFLSAESNFEEIPEEDLQKVVDAVISTKKIREGNFDYNRIDSVNFLRRADKDEVTLGRGEEGRAKGDKLYVTEDHLYHNPYRFSLVSLLFHETTHNMQYFRLSDNPYQSLSEKPELVNPADVGDFKNDLMSYASNRKISDYGAVRHMLESDYFGQEREIEAYNSQYKYMQEILRDLAPIMRNGSMEMRDTFKRYLEMNSKYFPIGHENRHKKDGVLWESGRRVVDEYLVSRKETLEKLRQEGDLNSQLSIQTLSSILSGLHYSYNEDTAKYILDYIYEMPENSFEEMSNKAMAINSLVTSTKMPVNMEMMSTLGGLFENLSKMPENGAIEGHYRNMTYNRERYYLDYAFYDKGILDDTYGASYKRKVN